MPYDYEIPPELYYELLQGGSSIRGAQPDINKSQIMAQELRKLSAMPKGQTVGPMGVYHAPNPLEYLGAGLSRYFADQELNKTRDLEKMQADAKTKQNDAILRALLSKTTATPTDDQNWNLR